MTSDRPLICFDLGGVVIRICRSLDEGCRMAGVDARHDQALLDRTAAARHDLVVAYQTGAFRLDEYAARLSAIVDGLYSPAEIRAIHIAWTMDEYDGVADLIETLHDRGHTTACLSNTNESHWEILGSSVAIGRMHHLVASHLVELHKPDPEIYRAFERIVDRPAAEIVFFDDTPENITAAQAAGWDAHEIDPMTCTATQMRAVLGV